MQYLLTKEEYDELVKTKKELSKKEEKALQDFCSWVADNYILTKGWMKDNVWGCILTVNKDEEWYCDSCPSQKICPYPYKHWSQ